MTTILILVTIALGAWLAVTVVRGRQDASQDSTTDFARAMEAISRPGAPDRHPRQGAHRLRPARKRQAPRRARRRLPR